MNLYIKLNFSNPKSIIIHHKKGETLTRTPHSVANVFTLFKTSSHNLVFTILYKTGDTQTVVACVKHNHFFSVAIDKNGNNTSGHNDQNILRF